MTGLSPEAKIDPKQSKILAGAPALSIYGISKK
jgi:hypothetical protein